MSEWLRTKMINLNATKTEIVLLEQNVKSVTKN